MYTLRHREEKGRDTVVPVVYVCEAEDECEAERIHKRVWNQNVVPFLILAAPKTIRLYSGFRYERQQPDAAPEATGLLRAASDMKSALKFLEAFRADRIDDGSVWEDWGHEVTPSTKVDWRLLSSLNDLDGWLQASGIADPEVSHALIGKYVYLNYLRQRDILSDLWLKEWGLEERHLFGRQAKASSVWQLVRQLDERLNGSVFPLPKSGGSMPKPEHIRKVAATLAGDDPSSGQLALEFGLYDFSFIPIETLSVIYEQFLHSPCLDGGESPGKEKRRPITRRCRWSISCWKSSISSDRSAKQMASVTRYVLGHITGLLWRIQLCGLAYSSGSISAFRWASAPHNFSDTL